MRRCRSLAANFRINSPRASPGSVVLIQVGGAAFVLDMRFTGQRYDVASGLNQKAAQAAIFEARIKMNDMLIGKGKMYRTPGGARMLQDCVAVSKISLQ